MKMSLIECEDRARDEGYNTATFDLCGILGRKKCKWLDAYMGMFQFEGHDGFVMTNDVKHMNVWCENFSARKAKSPCRRNPDCGAEPKNAIAAGKDRADRIFRASYKPHPPSAA